MLNQRRVTLLRSLLTQDDRRPTVADLARRFGVSERLIRYDLDEVGDWLRPRNGQLLSDPRGRLSVAGDRDRLLADLQAVGPGLISTAEYVLTPEERRQWIATALLNGAAAPTIGALAGQLAVSRGTIYTDLDDLANWLSRYGITLQRSKAGLGIDGPESSMRKAIVALALERIGIDQLVLRVAHWERTDCFENEFPDLPPAGHLRAALGALRTAESFTGMALADASFAEMVLHLAVAVDRISRGKRVEAPVADGPPLDSLEERAAQILAAQLEAISGIHMDDAETKAFSRMLQSAGMRLGPGQTPTPCPPDALDLAARFVATVESLLGIELSQDRDLIAGLALHLRPIPHRLAQHPPIQNPLLRQIQEAFPELYGAAERASLLLSRVWGQEIPAAEIGFLTMHLGAALERLRVARPHKPRVVAVCSSGVGSARLLASRLETALPEVELAAVTSLRALAESLSSGNCDLVIATCPVPPLDIPVVCVSPLLGAGDLAAIRRALQNGGDASPNRKKVYQPMLTEVLTPELIRLDLDAGTWEEAVRLAGQVLVEAGAAEPRYVEAMVEGVRRVGPYIVIAPGVAMPHARPEDGVRKLAISLVRLRQPVRFGHATNDPVVLVFALAAIDVETHLKALAQLSVLLGSEDGIAGLKGAESVTAVLEVVARNAEERG